MATDKTTDWNLSSPNNLGILADPRSLLQARYRGSHPPIPPTARTIVKNNNLLSNWKSQSVVLPSKFSSKHFNLTRYQTAGHATWKVGGQHTMDDWTCHLRQCANIWCRTNSRRMLSKVIPTATCFNGTPTYGNYGLTLTVKISKRIGIRKDTLILPNNRRQP